MKILFVSHQEVQSQDFLIEGFQNYLKDDFETLYLKSYSSLKFRDKISIKSRIYYDFFDLNKRVLNKTKEFNPNVIIFSKSNYIKPSTLKFLKHNNPKLKLVSWSNDNMLKKHNNSFNFIKSILLFDLHLYNKSYEKDHNQYIKLGAKKIYYFDKAFSKTNHRPLVNENSQFSFDILFIGTYEKKRFEYMQFLAENNRKINIFGNGWEKVKAHKNLIIHNRPLISNDYAEAISNSKITLCFLRQINEDTQTSRSFEIPACGGAMIAERTLDHQRLFKEGLEADFFETQEELLQKVNYYLEDNNRIKKLKSNAINRSLQSDYTFERLVKQFIEILE